LDVAEQERGSYGILGVLAPWRSCDESGMFLQGSPQARLLEEALESKMLSLDAETIQNALILVGERPLQRNNTDTTTSSVEDRHPVVLPVPVLTSPQS